MNKKHLLPIMLLILVPTVFGAVYFLQLRPFELVSKSYFFWTNYTLNTQTDPSPVLDIEQTSPAYAIVYGLVIQLEDINGNLYRTIAGSESDPQLRVQYSFGSGLKVYNGKYWISVAIPISTSDKLVVKVYSYISGWTLVGTWKTGELKANEMGYGYLDMYYYIDSRSGSYIYKFRVGGTTSRINVPLNVVPVVPPKASFTWSPSSVYANDIVTFNASASTPDGGSIISYDWNFGDGSIGSGVIVTHTYTTAKDYIVTLTITDSDGQTGQLQKTLTIKTLPKASFTYSSNPTVGKTVTFTSTSTGSIISYTWTFGDGKTGTGKIAYNTYSNPGPYVVSLTVDDGAKIDTATQTLIVSDLPPTVSIINPLDMRFPSNRLVNLTVVVKKDSSLVSNAIVRMDIKRDSTYLITQSSATGTDGRTTFTFTSPLSGTYIADFTVGDAVTPTNSFTMFTIAGLDIQFINPSTTQYYDLTGGYDLILNGKVIDSETGFDLAITFNPEIYEVRGPNNELVYSEKPLISGAMFTFKAKIYNFYKVEQVIDRTVTVNLRFSSINYYSISKSLPITMKTPTLYPKLVDNYRNPLPNTIPTGTSEFYVMFYTYPEQLFSDLTQDKIGIIIEKPDKTRLIGGQTFTIYWQDSKQRLYVNYAFEQLGTYKVEVSVTGLSFDVPSKTFFLNVEEASVLPWWITSPYVWLVAGIIVFIILIKRRKGGRKIETW